MKKHLFILVTFSVFILSGCFSRGTGDTQPTPSGDVLEEGNIIINSTGALWNGLSGT